MPTIFDQIRNNPTYLQDLVRDLTTEEANEVCEQLRDGLESGEVKSTFKQDGTFRYYV